MRIAVAGGTGWVGRHVVEQVRAAGAEPVVLARSAGVDLTTGAGLEVALTGVGAVIDVSNVTTTSRRRAVGFFEAVTNTLLSAGARAGVRHHLALSIVGCDQVDFGYYVGKRRQEELVLEAGTPGTVLRATQFHEFAAQTLDRGTAFTVVVPRMLSQPVAARELAYALVRLAGQAPAGRVPDLAGPEQLQMTDMVRQLARVRGLRRLVLPVRLPGAAGRQMAGGALLPDPDGPHGLLTYRQWLDTADAGVSRSLRAGAAPDASR